MSEKGCIKIKLYTYLKLNQTLFLPKSSLPAPNLPVPSPLLAKLKKRRREKKGIFRRKED